MGRRYNTMVIIDPIQVSAERQRACLVCGDELPPPAAYTPWFCPECLDACEPERLALVEG